MDEERSLFEWLRHYLAALVLSLLLGVLAAAAAIFLVPRDVEAWSVAVQMNERIPPRQLGPLATAIFRSDAVYGPAMSRLGIEGSPEDFLEDHAELRPIPETDALIVIGRASSRERAAEISDTLTQELISALKQRAMANFSVFERVVASGRGLSLSVGLAAGGAAGLWFGIAAAILHYYWRRPVLSLSIALDLLGHPEVTVIKGRRPAMLGVLRGRPRLRTIDEDGDAARHALAAWAGGGGSSGGVRRVGARSATRSVGQAAMRGSLVMAPPHAVIAHAGTPRSALIDAWQRESGSRRLVWVR